MRELSGQGSVYGEIIIHIKIIIKSMILELAYYVIVTVIMVFQAVIRKIAKYLIENVNLRSVIRINKFILTSWV